MPTPLESEIIKTLSSFTYPLTPKNIHTSIYKTGMSSLLDPHPDRPDLEIRQIKRTCNSLAKDGRIIDTTDRNGEGSGPYTTNPSSTITPTRTSSSTSTSPKVPKTRTRKIISKTSLPVEEDSPSYSTPSSSPTKPKNNITTKASTIEDMNIKIGNSIISDEDIINELNKKYGSNFTPSDAALRLKTYDTKEAESFILSLILSKSLNPNEDDGSIRRVLISKVLDFIKKNLPKAKSSTTPSNPENIINITISEDELIRGLEKFLSLDLSDVNMLNSEFNLMSKRLDEIIGYFDDILNNVLSIKGIDNSKVPQNIREELKDQIRKIIKLRLKNPFEYELLRPLHDELIRAIIIYKKTKSPSNIIEILNQIAKSKFTITHIFYSLTEIILINRGNKDPEISYNLKTNSGKEIQKLAKKILESEVIPVEEYINLIVNENSPQKLSTTPIPNIPLPIPEAPKTPISLPSEPELILSPFESHIKLISSSISISSINEIVSQVQDLMSLPESLYDSTYEKFLMQKTTGYEEAFIYLHHKHLIDPTIYDMIKAKLLNK